VLDLRLAASLEGFHAAVAGIANRVPEAHWRLHTQLFLEGSQWGGSVVRPVTPSGACQPILEEHPDDGHHGKPAVGKLSIELLLANLRVLDAGVHDANGSKA